MILLWLPFRRRQVETAGRRARSCAAFRVSSVVERRWRQDYEFKSQPKLLFNSLGMMTSPDPALWDTVFLTPVKVVGPTEIRFKMHWSRPDLHQHESPSIDVTSSLWPTGYEDVPQTAMVVASSDRYPTARPCEPRIIELLELASGVWTHESDFTYSKLSRQVVRVVVEELQHHRPLAGSSLPGQDDLWNIILEYAIGRD